ncbi:hypothetical protein [Kovacikia minuta]|nr:hypothetical protein [Kovacikia minuta]
MWRPFIGFGIAVSENGDHEELYNLGTVDRQDAQQIGRRAIA